MNHKTTLLVGEPMGLFIAEETAVSYTHLTLPTNSYV